MARTSSQSHQGSSPPSARKIHSVKRTPSSSQVSKSQQSILGFFQKQTPSSSAKSSAAQHANGTPRESKESKSSRFGPASKLSLTPVPSSDGPEIESPGVITPGTAMKLNADFGLSSPSIPAARYAPDSMLSSLPSSPLRKMNRVNYSESDDDEDENAYKLPTRRLQRGRAVKRRKTIITDDDDDDDDFVDSREDEDMDDFIVDDDVEEDYQLPKKRKHVRKPRSKPSSEVPSLSAENKSSEWVKSSDINTSSQSTAQQWTYDPDHIEPLQPRSVNAQPRKTSSPSKKVKEKAYMTDPEMRYPWLANVLDADRNPPGHPDYDPRTIYVPPAAWAKFSPFEKQYWEIKQKFWDTVVFFKKGKFYELYENDATIGHQQFDLKLTDRVNMRMVGVPESSLDYWANQFVAKGYKIARVDQKETALGKQMRERDGKKGRNGKEDKVIRRELACVLTAGTLVDGGMLQDDMSTYCVSIKQSETENPPSFGIVFTDTSTGQFFITEFVDDAEYTKFETLIAQIRPQELLIEKGRMSVKSLRILKNNTGQTCIFNYLKPVKEFWEGNVTAKEIEASGYFVSEHNDNANVWPEVLAAARDQKLVMSALGALIYYLRALKLDRELVSLGNFSWYDPIRKANSLVLDGQTLINLEIFANTFDGGSDGTLFALLNRCVTPFGKRMFKQWMCHPLVDAEKINDRLDAVEALNADPKNRDIFSSQMTKIPDLERLISRVHAGRCKASDFLNVINGFEQIDYTMSLVGEIGRGKGIIGTLVSAMPDLSDKLKYWRTAFDHNKAKEENIFVPEKGVEEDFDASQEHIEEILSKLENHLHEVRKQLGSRSIVYRDNGKEIYQLEVPSGIKVPKTFDQMSATSKVKRFYNPALRVLIRELQEAKETHAQITKEVSARFYHRFDEDYSTWLSAVKVVAHLDSLICLAKASLALGQPSCRPRFVDSKRSIISFEDLRHPCMLPSVSDFIPNSVHLGGDVQNINLLTGANAAGKSTVLRMTCVAVILAQIGCFVPAVSATLTPVDRIMSRLGANDNIFANQSTFFVELSETKKILSEATPRTLVILDELGRGTSSYDGVAVAYAVLYQIATHIHSLGFFATHYHSLAEEFSSHPEIANKRMKIAVDDESRSITFLYKLEDGIAEGSFGMHCASMCGIPKRVVDRAEQAAQNWEYTNRIKEKLKRDMEVKKVQAGVRRDFGMLVHGNSIDENAWDVLCRCIDTL